ncbi:LuxR C-terminal-related transcriptional regulator [Streptomyces sp. NPDC019396]|uniref:ATP-binding protein n=1 Tax=Streptomyces sp. NPDC019396 TaxID=3154687 RepID=UPI0034084A7B
MRSLTNSPVGLTSPLTDFVGRRAELRRVKDMLGEARLVTITGVAGVGKSRLALQAARDLRRLFPDGASLADLSGVEEGQSLRSVVGPVLGFSAHSVDEDVFLEVLAAFLGESRILLILDNCEHLVEACGRLVTGLLSKLAGLHVIVTSRHPLEVFGERTLALEPLPVVKPAAGTDGEHLCDALRLFENRARFVAPDFRLTAGNYEEALEVCARVDGIPLGIELAAARLRTLSLKEIGGLLKERFEILDVGNKAALPRHQTLQAAVDWSYQLCSPGDRQLWNRLSVFTDSFDLEAARRVCLPEASAASAATEVSSLVTQSVVVRMKGEGAARYRMLETIRHYGAQKLSEDLRNSVRARHRDYYLELAERSHGDWFSSRQRLWFQKLCLEQGNLRAALDYCCSEPAEAECGFRMVLALRDLWQPAGLVHEAYTWITAFLSRAEGGTPARARVAAVGSILAMMRRERSAAQEMYDEAQALARATGDANASAHTLYARGMFHLFEGDLSLARGSLEEGLAFREVLDDLAGVSTFLLRLVTVSLIEDSLAEADARAVEAIELSAERGELWQRSAAECLRGMVLWRQGLHESAAASVRRSAHAKRLFQDRMGLALCSEVLAWISVGKGELVRAATLFGALHRVWKADIDVPLVNYFSGFHEQAIQDCRQRLSQEEYEAATSRGLAMPVDELVTFALEGEGEGEGEDEPTAADAERQRYHPLTPREQEVARLVAEGKSNREIAAALVVSSRTAENHVQKILTKLGFSRRGQVAAWFYRET